MSVHLQNIILLAILVVASQCHRTHFDRRMGVIGPPPTEGPALYHPGDFIASSSDVSAKLEKLSKQNVPLSPYSPHNIFTVQQGVGGFGTDSRGSRSQVAQERVNEISNEYDLELKIKALDKAKESSDKHHFLSDGSIQCDQFVINSEFYIRTPNYPYNYPANTTCEFQVYRNTSACGVELTVLRFDLAPPDSLTERCRDRFVVNGVNYCGRRQRGDKTLVPFPGMFMPMKFESGPGHGASGVLLRGRQVTDCTRPKPFGQMITSVPQCVRYIVGDTFSLSSPDFPLNYPHNAECWYHIQRKSSDHCGIELTVQRFALEAASCMFDYLETSRNRICGKKAKGTKYYFPYNKRVLSVRFRSDESISRPGFLLEGRQVPCSDVGSFEQTYNDPKTHQDFIKASNTRVVDPKIPGASSSEDDDDDINYILSLAGQVPELILEDAFEGTRQSLGRQLGQSADREVIILGDEVVLNDVITGREADETETLTTIETVEDPTTTATTTAIPIIFPETTRGGGTGREITTEIDPLVLSTTLYVNDTQSPDDFVIEATSGVPLPDPNGVPLPDAIGVPLPDSNGASLPDSIGVPLPDPSDVTTQTSSSTQATLFTDADALPTESLTSNTGITELPSPVFTTTDNTELNDTGLGECDEIYVAEAFTLRSPVLTKDDKDTDCSFYVKRASSDICEIRMLLLEMNLENRNSEGKCEDDYLQIAATRFCGRDENKRVRVRYPGEQIKLKLFSTAPENDTGFLVRVLQLRGTDCDRDADASNSSLSCDVIADRERTTILSPHYPSPAPNNLNCVITVRKASPRVKSVSLWLEEFDVEESEGCQYDHLTIGDTKFCGKRSGQKVSFGFAGDDLQMLFHTNDDNKSKGYRIHIRQERYRTHIHPTTPIYGVPTHTGARPPLSFNPSTPRPPDAIAVLIPSPHPPTYTPYRPRPPPPLYNIVGGFSGFAFNTTTTNHSAGTTNELPPALSGQGVLSADNVVLTECDSRTKAQFFTIKSPNYPDTPPKDLNCVYNVEKSSTDICNLKIEIVDMQMGSRIECGRSFLQVGQQQRLCGTRRGNEIRTYHFIPDVMQLIFHTDPEGQDGGFHVTVQQVPCGHFEPLGTLAGINTISLGAPHILPSSTSPPTNQISISELHTTNHIISKPLNGHFDVIHTTSQGAKEPASGYGPPPPKPELELTPSVATSPPTYHYLYYYLPSGTYQNTQQKSKGSGKGSFVRRLQSKFDNFASKFQFEAGFSSSKGKGFGKSEGRHKRPYRRPTVQVTPEKPVRYAFVKNPYYRHNNKKSAVRFRYPQTYTRRPQVVQQHSVRYPNAYIVFPRPQVTVTRIPVTTTRAPPVRYTAQPSYASRPFIRFTTPRPVYVTTRRPVYVTTAKPAVVITRNPRPPKVVRNPVTPRPVINLVTPSYPVYAVTPAPAAGHALVFPQTTTSTVRFRANSEGFKPSTYNSFLVTPIPSAVFPRSAEKEGSDEKSGLIASASHSNILTSSNVFKVEDGRRGKELTSSSEAPSTTTIAPVPQSATEIIQTAKGCGRRITEEEFKINSPDFSKGLFKSGFLTCTYTIVKSDSNKCSMVLEIEEFELTGPCSDSSLFIGDTTYCSDKKPSVHMVTSFSATGELLLQFNESASVGGDAKFSIKGRQITCGATTLPLSTPSSVSTLQRQTPLWPPSDPHWGAGNWIPPATVGRPDWNTIRKGASGVRGFRSSFGRGGK